MFLNFQVRILSLATEAVLTNIHPFSAKCVHIENEGGILCFFGGLALSTFVEGKIQLPSSEKYATRSHRHRHHHLNFCSYKMEDRTQDSKVSRWIDRTYRSSL